MTFVGRVPDLSEGRRPEVIDEIVAALAAADCGLPRVKSMGLALDDCVQVSMDLVDYRVTSMSTVYEEIARRARLRGVQVRESEVVGLVPEAALVDAARRAPVSRGFSQ